jgi:putative transcription factor
MAEEGWTTVSKAKKPSGPKPRAPRSEDPHSEKAVNRAIQSGVPVDTNKKFNAGANKQHYTDRNTAALDRETEELHHDRVSVDVGRLIQQRRNEMNLSQKDLAVKISEQQKVVADYEAGRGIPSQQVFNKLEKILGIRLRGNNKGQPL